MVATVAGATCALASETETLNINARESLLTAGSVNRTAVSGGGTELGGELKSTRAFCSDVTAKRCRSTPPLCRSQTCRGARKSRFDGKTFRYFSQKDGLGTGCVPSLSENLSGNLWFGTTSGVYRFDGERFVNFTKSD